ncbi:MAG TPA: DUF2807 domain-containing protein [Rhizomicrobium sp.]|nr:DUF2807 domain-containing protein [Rhizomicrobium sp.]
MPRTLVISSVTGLVLCAIFLGLAVRIGGDDIFHDAHALEPMKPLIDLASHKAWQWNGGDTLALDAPINVRYQPKASPQSAPQVALIGPAELLQHVKVSDGRIAADTNIPRASGKKIEAVVSGVTIRKFVVNGGENLDLGEIDQQGLDLHLNGSGTVSGRGRVNQLNLTIAGPGKANLGGLSVMEDAKVSILGSGDASLSPHGRVKLFIAGSGNLQLLTKPTELRQTIVGSGEANQLAGEAAQEALKAVDASRVASEAANSAIRSVLGNSSIGDIAAQAARNGIENADIDRHVREGIARGLAQATIDPATGNVAVHGHRDVDLGHIERAALNVTVADSGSLTAEGKVDRLTVNVLGSGDVRLGKLAARSVTVSIMGSGSATLAPSESLTATIMGSGDVHLATRPAQIQRNIMGSGRIVEDH